MTMVVKGAALCAAALAAMSAAAHAEDIPAKRKYDRTPAYPASCRPSVGAPAQAQRITVVYDVSKKGLPENVEVMETTDPCFNDAAIAAVQGWTFEPRRVDGKAVAQGEIETTFVFKFEEPTYSEDFDARPLIRIPPNYPENCMRAAKAEETVIVQFDVTTVGATKNAAVIESTNPCLDAAALASVQKWKYRPKTVAGKPVERTGVVTNITFQLANGPFPEEKVRPPVSRGLNHARRLLQAKKYDETLSVLADLEEKYGDGFSQAEMQSFHQLRGVARLGVKDYAGALDDLKIARQYGLPTKAAEAINKMIVQLEAIVAAQQAAGQGAQGAEEAPSENQDGEAAQQ